MDIVEASPVGKKESSPILQYAYHGSIIALLLGLLVIVLGRWVIDIYLSRDWWTLVFFVVFGSFVIGLIQMIFMGLFWLTHLSVLLGDWILKFVVKWPGWVRYVAAIPLGLIVIVPAVGILSFASIYLLGEGLLLDEVASALIQMASYVLTMLMFAYVIPSQRLMATGLLGGVFIVLSIIGSVAVLPLISNIAAVILVLREVQILEKKKAKYLKLSDSLGLE